jgi:hypothetical protein
MTNLEHALSILHGVIEKQKRQHLPVGQLTLVKSYILSEMEKDSALKYDTSEILVDTKK